MPGKFGLPQAPGGGITHDVLQKIANGELDNSQLFQSAGFNPAAKFSVGPDLVKGTRSTFDKPTDDYDVITTRQRAAEKVFMASIHKSWNDPIEVCKGLNPMFGGPLARMIQANPTYQIGQWIKNNLDKSFTTTSPLGSGLVPYDLVAPTWLIYPVYTPLRNRIPRPAGQGKQHQAKVITSILGSAPSQYGNPNLRTSITEFPGGGSFSSWPNQLPGTGSQTAFDVTIPYKFFGLTEAATWLAQFESQGFDDAAALASLILLQQFMLSEERAMIGATGTAVVAPTSVAGVDRSTLVAGEVGLSGVTTNVYVRVTALNYYGETVSTASSGISTSNGHVVDVTITGIQPATLCTNIYVGTGTADPGVAGSHLMASFVGGTVFTLQGALPTATATPPTADTGTSSANDYYGIVSILSGQAEAATIYPTPYVGGYYTHAANDTLSVNLVQTALKGVYDSTSASYFADPTELWAEASDLTNLSQNIANVGAAANLNYTIFINQDQIANVAAGVAVSQFVNPITRSTVRLTVHPYFPQGTAVGMSYTMPQTQTNVSNIWENVMVQDYISINWPVIDVTFRYSLLMFGTLFCAAPMYNFLLQGIQRSNAKPYS